MVNLKYLVKVLFIFMFIGSVNSYKVVAQEGKSEEVAGKAIISSDSIANCVKEKVTSEEQCYNVLNKSYKKPDNTSKWEAQLRTIKENDSLLRSINLELFDYVFDKKVKDRHELEKIKCAIAKQMFDPKEGCAEFSAASTVGTMANLKSILDQLLPTSSEQLALVSESSNDSKSRRNPVYYFEDDDLSTVKLRWKYKGNIYTTTCLVSERQGIIYDNLLYFTAFPDKVLNELKEYSIPIE